jgi:DNA invertase Pin-like site-specific DNA recombinase
VAGFHLPIAGGFYVLTDTRGADWMTTQHRERDRGLFYTRDSGGKHELTPPEYVEWTRRRAKELGVRFSGTPERITAMMKSGVPVDGDLFFDFCVQGHVFTRPALDQLREMARCDSSVSHIFIPRRNRLSRPDDPLDALELEEELRLLGITLVLMDKVLLPLKKRGRRDMGETIVAMMEYEESGRFRPELAEKIIPAQLRLAKLGYSTGGRPPFGFRRWLVKEDGTPIRQLAEGEIIRQSGHHVIWLPGPE